MAFIQIPLSNTLRMVRTDNQGTNLQNFSNRLLWQEDYVDYNDRPYTQKISSADNILVQFATDVALNLIKTEIYDLNDQLVSDKSGNISLVLESTSFNVYDLLFTFAVKGNYYLKMTFNSAETYESEIFQIDGFETEKMIKVEYNTGENDGIVYNNNQTFVIRFEARLVECTPDQDKEVYTNFNESLVNLNSYPTRKYKMEYGPVPRFIVEKLNLALSHEVFKINDVEYQSKDAPGSDLIKDNVTVTNLYEGTVNLQEVNYENYTEASDDIQPTIKPIIVDQVDTVLFIVDQGTTYYTKYVN
jgi:hypothetical protein